MKLQGIPVSEGYALGEAVRLKSFCWRPEAETEFSAGGSAENKKHLLCCIQELSGEYQKNAEALRRQGKAKQAELMSAHEELLRDCMFQDEILALVENAAAPEQAVRNVTEQLSAAFQETGNKLLQERITDIRDIAARLIQLLRGEKPQDINSIPYDCILFAEEIPTSVMAEMDNPHIKAIVTTSGSKTSHTAILSKSMGMPAVMGCNIEKIKSGAAVFVDGALGTVSIGFSSEEKEEYLENIAEEQKTALALEQYISEATRTSDGRQVGLFINLMDIQPAGRVGLYHADGVGLYRTEMLFLERKNEPSEEEQFTIYKALLQKLNGKPAVFRTIDIGGDKPCEYMPAEKEENPFLGVRGIRLSLRNEAIFRTQIRAILRASAWGEAKIMLPMVSTLQEVLSAKKIVREEQEKLLREELPCAENIPLGIMLEVPAAVIMTDVFLRYVDFVSIGSNDLTQYTMAADRYNPNTASLCAACQPSVLRLVAYAANCSKLAGKPCCVCGEAASDVLLLPFLLGAGITELSVNANAALRVRKKIIETSYFSAQELAEQVLMAQNDGDVLALLNQFAAGK